jgi:hypothetical protein
MLSEGTHAHIFLFPTIASNNMADGQTFEVTLKPLNVRRIQKGSEVMEF